jgi:hypothetical protein
MMEIQMILKWLGMGLGGFVIVVACIMLVAVFATVGRPRK